MQNSAVFNLDTYVVNKPNQKNTTEFITHHQPFFEALTTFSYSGSPNQYQIPLGRYTNDPFSLFSLIAQLIESVGRGRLLVKDCELGILP